MIMMIMVVRELKVMAEDDGVGGGYQRYESTSTCNVRDDCNSNVDGLIT